MRRRFLLLLASCISNVGCSTQAPLPPPTQLSPDGSALSAHSSRSMNGDLLYISDPGAGGVAVYSYSPSSLNQVGFLRRPDQPGAACVDIAQHVFVPKSELGHHAGTFEYIHGGAQPLRVVRIAKDTPLACAFDPTARDLTITTGTTDGGSSDVAVYHHATGTPTIYVSPDLVWISACTYDDAGNLYVNGVDYYGHPGFNVLAKSASHLVDLTVTPATLQWPSAMHWLHHKLIIAQYTSPTVALGFYTVTGTVATQVGTIALQGASQISSFAIHDRNVVATIVTTDAKRALAIYPYPQGGTPTTSLTDFKNPQSVVLSLGAPTR
jgi:hypothetical protein